ncbi:CheR family methyltransferase [Paraburkholderia sp. BCC1885]|uniref:CheR family methyltransferase n=1 Tax=Paraburkholderia sp. BCC1885 TaxID=2562669 RepID=UPI0011827A6D|nr:CheR family methyltransferase [Paraburkholderia sp. BCC1885]
MNATDPCFETWLSQETGIDAHSLGINALERAVLDRVRATRADSPQAPLAEDAVDAYWQHLNDSRDERLALIEALVVPETWFFRDREAFVTLARLANEKLARDPARVLRVLSVPCSSGEEPYSAAMALLDIGIGAERFVIDAIDISARAIELAQHAVYGRNSFRGGEFGFRERHFNAKDGGWVLNERVRESVRFAQANLFEAASAATTPYDFIFCRNVLIYFRREAQDRAIHLLEARLAEGGTIFVGPAETGLMMRHALSSARIPLAFAFQRTSQDQVASQGVAMPRNVKDEVSSTVSSVASMAAATAGNGSALHGVYGTRKPALAPAVQATPARPAQPVARVKPAPVSASKESLDEARRLADAGHFDQAEHEAQKFVNVHGTDAEAFYLLGLIADARGRTADASDYYRKTLYLEPAHYEALTHLAALLDMTGDGAGAQQLLRRAERAAAKRPAMTEAPLNSSRGAHGTRRH